MSKSLGARLIKDIKEALNDSSNGKIVNLSQREFAKLKAPEQITKIWPQTR